MDLGNISDNIAAARKKSGKTLDDMAQLLGYESRQAYFRLEKKGNKLTIEQLQNIANALGIDIHDLLFDQGEEDNVLTNYAKYITFVEHMLDWVSRRYDESLSFSKDMSNFILKDEIVRNRLDVWAKDLQEKWRLRDEEYYRNGDYSDDEETQKFIKDELDRYNVTKGIIELMEETIFMFGDSPGNANEPKLIRVKEKLGIRAGFIGKTDDSDFKTKH